MVPLSLHLPFAALEVGQQLYWQLGNLRLHGQVFLSSWVVIGALLTLVVVGTRSMERDPRDTAVSQPLRCMTYYRSVWKLKCMFFFGFGTNSNRT